MSRFAAIALSFAVLFLAFHIVLAGLVLRRTNGPAWQAFRWLMVAELLRATGSLGWMWKRAEVLDVNPFSIWWIVTTLMVILAAAWLARELTRRSGSY